MATAVANVSPEYGPIGGMDEQAELLRPIAPHGSSRRRTVIALLALGSGAVLATISLSSKSGRLRAMAGGSATNELIGLAENDKYQCTWSWGKGMGSWQDVWPEEQQKWCCENKQLGCPTKPLFNCSEGYENWQLGWSPIKKTWCCDSAKRGCAEPICQPVVADSPDAPKLFCASIIRPHGYEPKLMQEQLKKCVHIFSCDDWAVVSDKTVYLSQKPQVTTLAFDAAGAKLAAVAGDSFNANPFKRFWETIKEDGRYKLSDWTVKADPDTVFFPARLKMRLAASSYTGTEPMVFANCGADSTIGPHNGKPYLYGALELISRSALVRFFTESETCETGDQFEEQWLTDCFHDIGIELNHKMDLDLLRDDNVRCSNDVEAEACTHDSVAFHNFSDIDSWFKCFQEATAEHKA